MPEISCHKKRFRLFIFLLYLVYCQGNSILIALQYSNVAAKIGNLFIKWIIFLALYLEKEYDQLTSANA